MILKYEFKSGELYVDENLVANVTVSYLPVLIKLDYVIEAIDLAIASLLNDYLADDAAGPRQ